MPSAILTPHYRRYPVSLLFLEPETPHNIQSSSRIVLTMDRSWRQRALALLSFSALAVLAACGGNVAVNGALPNPLPGPVTPNNPSPTSSATPSIEHVIVVVEENHSYESVIGNPDMPYLNGLATRYGLATTYYANTHPSIGNYFMLTTGAIITNDDAFSGTVSADNLARILKAAGKTWKVYAESLPSTGYLGGDTGAYVKHHNPFAYFSDVIADPSQAQNIVPFSQFASDLSAGLPNYAFVVPNVNDDAHSGTLATADAWLQSNVDPVLRSASFQQSGLLLIVFDESFLLDLANGGGHVAAVLAGPRVKPGFRSTTFFQHQSALRLALDTLGVKDLPGAAAGAPAMGEFFQ